MTLNKFDTEYYLELYNSRQFAKKLQRAREIRDEGLSRISKGYVSWSGGKDSTAVLFLVREVCPYYKCVKHDDDCEYPDTLKYVKKLQAKYGLNLDILQPSFSVWEKIVENAEILGEEIHNSNIDFASESFYGVMKKYYDEGDYDGMFWGLRAEESKARKHNAIFNGANYLKGDSKICCPITWWTGDDVFAYLVGNNIQINPLYYKCKFTEPGRIRDGWWLPGKTAYKGHLSFLRYYYPDLYQKLLTIRRDLNV